MTIRPRGLVKGDTVGIIAPASPPNQEQLQNAIAFFEELGLNVKFGKYIHEINGYLAGKDQERVEDLHAMFADPEVKAIFCACGGYGTPRIASQIDFELIQANPKIFWGYSDITFLHNSIHQETGLVTFHGPMPASDIGKPDCHQDSKDRFQQLFSSHPFRYDESIAPIEVLVEGNAEGVIVGGNLTLIVSTLGTKFEIDTKNKVLLIEDVNEEPRQVDRYLNHLYMAGKLTDASAILFGDFANCVPERELSLTLDEVLAQYAELAGRPTLKGLRIGHCNPHYSIPLGVKATVDTCQKTVIIEHGIQS
ncbi:S66 peptidase family protein [Peribacillus acanthi]|uniref:S66 peptidase family protein n=1 Tax=Peribacillus acanthi TaxID=2171554 RepID=UPI000D3E2ADA|nr:LD-carboxypeptidase [Peribacillus acanthi]